MHEAQEKILQECLENITLKHAMSPIKQSPRIHKNSSGESMKDDHAMSKIKAKHAFA